MRIALVDTETSDFEDPRVIELAVYFLNEHTLTSDTSIPGDSWLFSPGEGRVISPLASAVHHLVDADVAPHPVFDKDCWDEAIGDADYLAAHNAAFDRGVIEAAVGKIDQPFICTMKCARVVWPEAPSHGNQQLRYWLKLRGADSLALHAHRAAYDAIVTAWMLRRLRAHLSIEAMLEISSKPSLLPRCNFGKHRGSAWKDVPKDYLRWVLGQDFDEDVRYTAKHWMAHA